jgi:hypothetical protein
MSDKILVDRELLESLCELGQDAIQRMGSYLAEKHNEQRHIDAAHALLLAPAQDELCRHGSDYGCKQCYMEEQATPVQQQEPIGTLHISHFRQDPSMENFDLQLTTDMPQGSHKLYLHPAPADALDAARYRWLRERLQIRFMEAVSGIKKEGITTRIGHCFLDADRIPGSGYLDQSKFQAECTALDAAIDAALASTKENRHE